MTSLPMLDNILGQPASHRGVLELHQDRNHAELAACAKHLRECRGRVIFSGMGASLFASKPAVSRLAQQGFRVQSDESAELLHYGSAGLHPGDVGVLISRSGGSVEVLRLAEKMRAQGATVIGVTNVPGSQLEHASDLCLLIGAQPDQLIAIQTYSGTVLALLLLAEEVIGSESARLSTACLDSLPVLSGYIEGCLRASDGWRDLFDGTGALYLLGRGPALASVHEGALLLHETAKAPAVAISSGQFRHGPVEVVSDAFRAVVIGTSPNTRAMDRALAVDLLKMGARVCWIGPGGEFDQTQPLVDWPLPGSESTYTSLLAPLFEIVPLQIAAYQLALGRGITPGDFRYASEITSSESGFPLFESRLSRA